ncbi:Zn2 DNA-binding protein [Venustampulla echinocandica]|uniref:Zn2 DNA-binding protein n=1 Tax=Venustampulla echinocandica TaxID=2656787 RepID=A0A370TR69_9HELO|nr:Zn2 DNA-binding protein [Venustampulla echinocandica]RDL38004.1 Zn2 DNA-binding protein [Venustampulla echinocandica]
MPRSLLPKSEAMSSSPSPSLDAAFAGGEAPPKRRCISSACMPCRKRKSKCDGLQPACHACTTAYHSECYYDIDSDHRRKGALKRDIAQLKEDLGPRNAILDAIRKGSESVVDDIIELIRSNPDESWDSIAERVETPSFGATEKAPLSSYLEGEVDSFSVKALAKPGDSRQYGHTSNLSSLLDDDIAPVSEISQCGAWTNVTDNEDLIKHLLDVYLAWSHPLYMLFSEEAFLYGMQERKLKYCTPLLVNAVLAVGCHFSDRPEARADPNDTSTVGGHFFAEAVRLFQENGRPSLTSVQALAAMSLHQAMNNNDSSGWLYMCQTIGMVIELGLHTNQPTQSNGEMIELEAAARRITFWGCYFLQTAWGMCVGRISMLPRTAIRVGKQDISDHLESKIWIPSGHPNYPSLASGIEQPGMRYTLLLHSSLLCEIVDDIVQLFYASRDRITSRKLQHHHEKLQEWHKALPESLAIKDTPTLPQVICLHVYYHNCVIQLFRPFLRYQFVEGTRTPRQIATKAANKISELMALYTQTYSLRRPVFMSSHCIVTAAVIHLVTLSPPNVPPKIREQTEIHVANAIRTLHEMHRSFPIVVRYLKSIRVLITRWCPVIPERIQEAMVDAGMGSPISTSSNPPDLNSQRYTNHANHTYHTNQMIIDDRKPSVHDANPHPHVIGPPVQNQTRCQTHNYQPLFWTPFPHEGDGVPLALPPELHEPVNQHMGIAGMPPLAIDRDWSQLNRYGFTMNGTGEGDVALWELNWDNHLGS